MSKNHYFGLKSRSYPRGYGQGCLMGLGEAEAGDMARCAADEGCLAKLGERQWILDSKVSQAERTKVEGIRRLKRVGLSWAMGEWERGLRVFAELCLPRL